MDLIEVSLFLFFGDSCDDRWDAELGIGFLMEYISIKRNISAMHIVEGKLWRTFPTYLRTRTGSTSYTSCPLIQSDDLSN
jgi:hypothetical protein